MRNTHSPETETAHFKSVSKGQDQMDKTTEHQHGLTKKDLSDLKTEEGLSSQTGSCGTPETEEPGLRLKKHRQRLERQRNAAERRNKTIAAYEPRTLAQKARSIRKGIRERAQATFKTGVKAFDDALNGVAPEDLIVLGAPTGSGKTQLCSIIAKQAARSGKNVCYYALEAADNDIDERMMFEEFADSFYNRDEPVIVDGVEVKHINERFFKEGHYDHPAFDKHWAFAEERLQHYGTLEILGREVVYTFKDFKKEFIAKARRVDLILLDHFQYLDFSADEKGRKNNLEKQSRAMEEFFNLVKTYKTPIVLVSHLRKQDSYGKSKRWIDVHELHGSSDIAKNATKIMLIQPDYETHVDKGWSTYFLPMKYRNGNVERYILRSTYKITTGNYEDSYTLLMKKGNDEPEEPKHSSQIPPWAQDHSKQEVIADELINGPRQTARITNRRS